MSVKRQKKPALYHSLQEKQLNYVVIPCRKYPMFTVVVVYVVFYRDLFDSCHVFVESIYQPVKPLFISILKTKTKQTL